MILAEIDSGTAVIVSGILGGGALAAIAAVRKAGPESESIAARTLIEVNNELRKELDRRDKIINSLEERLSFMRETIEGLEQEVKAFRASTNS